MCAFSVKREEKGAGQLIQRLRSPLPTGHDGVGGPHSHLRTETDPVSGKLCSFKIRVRELGNPRVIRHRHIFLELT
jgi:hypothetical protein